MRVLPSLVTKLVYGHEAWIVGSAAKPDCDHSKIRDYDVLVPLSNWREAAMLIPSDSRPNTFGGWKCKDDNAIIDIWPGDLSWFMTNSMARWAWHPRTGVRIKSI